MKFIKEHHYVIALLLSVILLGMCILVESSINYNSELQKIISEKDAIISDQRLEITSLKVENTILKSENETILAKYDAMNETFTNWENLQKEAVEQLKKLMPQP
jgi:hypothetical protein